MYYYYDIPQDIQTSPPMTASTLPTFPAMLPALDTIGNIIKDYIIILGYYYYYYCIFQHQAEGGRQPRPGQRAQGSDQR